MADPPNVAWSAFRVSGPQVPGKAVTPEGLRHTQVVNRFVPPAYRVMATAASAFLRPFTAANTSRCSLTVRLGHSAFS